MDRGTINHYQDASMPIMVISITVLSVLRQAFLNKYC